jgi:prolipoprotein diacylglyceryl transferase
MDALLLSFTWDFSRGLSLGPIELRYYSLLFALGFLLGYQVMKRYFIQEKISMEWLDTLLMYAVFGTIIGARLGHVFFYSWDYYSQNLIEILYVWEGGLASHGAAVALIFAMYLYSKKVTKKSMFWILDRFVITVALAGCFIRLGNMANSEIYGDIGNSAIETVYLDPVRHLFLNTYGEYISEVNFEKLEERLETDTLSYPMYRMELVGAGNTTLEGLEMAVKKGLEPLIQSRVRDDKNILFLSDYTVENDVLAKQPTVYVTVLGVPRLPTQLIEALGYLLIFVVLFALFKIERFRNANGFTFGMFLVLVFGFRFFVEFFKANQVAFEAALEFNMGQQLSIPLVIIGLFMITYGLSGRKPFA